MEPWWCPGGGDGGAGGAGGAKPAAAADVVGVPYRYRA